MLPRPKRPVTERQLQALFARYNKRFWKNTLGPAIIDLIPAGRAGRIVDSRCDWGGYDVIDGQAVIELRETDRLVHLGFLKANLLHEMVHHSIGADSYDHRSSAWRREVLRLSRMGALAETI